MDVWAEPTCQNPITPRNRGQSQHARSTHTISVAVQGYLIAWTCKRWCTPEFPVHRVIAVATVVDYRTLTLDTGWQD
eukprot:6846146-Alexandrium_andersonii.AAC.1